MCFPVEFNSRGAGTKTSLSPCPLPNSGGEQWVFIQCQRLTEAESARPGIRTQVFWLQRPCIWLLHSVESPNYKVVYSVALRWFFFILCLNLLLTDFHRISWTYTCLCLFHCGHLCLFLPCDLSLGGGAFLGPPRHPSPAKGGPNCWRHDPPPPGLPWPALALGFVILCQELAKGRIPEDRQSSGWKGEKWIICFWREFPFLFSSDLLKAFHWLVKKGSGFQMHCDLAKSESWSDAQMGICGLKELVRGGGWGGKRRGQWSKNKMNYLRWNIIPGYIYSKPLKKGAIFATK